METHPDKNVILRSLGVKAEVEVDEPRFELEKGRDPGLSSINADPRTLQTQEVEADDKEDD